MWNKDENLLIKDEPPLEYWVAHRASRTITLFDNMEEARSVISMLLEEGAEICENFYEFHRKYPPFTLEERIRMTDDWLREAGVKK